MIFDKLYKRDSKGKIRFFVMEVKGTSENAEIITRTGIGGSALITENVKRVKANKAASAVYRAVKLATTQQNKRLRLGYHLSEEAAKTAEVPLICMLVKDMLPGDIDNMKPEEFPIFQSVKLNGVRGTYHHDKRQILSREMKPFTNIDWIVEDCFRLCNDAKLDYLDFELYPGEDHKINEVVSMVKGDHPGRRKLQAWIFDLPVSFAATFASRQASMQTIKANFNTRNLMFVPTPLAKSKEDVKAFYEEVISLGGEGIILRQLEGHYAWNNKTTRSDIIRKVKPVISAEFRIVGVGVEERVVKGEGVSLICYTCETEKGEQFKVSPTGWGVEKRCLLANESIEVGFSVEKLPPLSVDFREWTSTGKPFHVTSCYLRELQ